MHIDRQLVDYVAQLAMLKLSDEEKDHSAAELERILAYVDTLNAMDTRGVEPMSHAFPVFNVLREDCVAEATPREEILHNAPAQKDGCFLVPRTVE